MIRVMLVSPNLTPVPPMWSGEEITLSRIPNMGELIRYGCVTLFVRTVAHIANPGGFAQPVAVLTCEEV